MFKKKYLIARWLGCMYQFRSMDTIPFYPKADINTNVCAAAQVASHLHQPLTNSHSVSNEAYWPY
jgi:hypothetical protein